MSHEHICEDCGNHFAGDGALVEIDDFGALGCDCFRQDRCESCEPVCEHCQEWDGVYTKATTTNPHGQPRCERCADRENESAHEASLSDFYGGSGAATDAERMDAAYTLDRGQK